MTIEPSVEFVEDATVENDICTLELSALPDGTKVGAAAWLVDSAADDGRSAVLTHIVERVANAERANVLWTVFGDAAWQPNSRVARHGGVWGRLSRRGLDVDELRQKREWVEDKDNQFRAFGTAVVTRASVSAALSVLKATGNGYLLNSTSDDTVAYGALRNRWESRPWFDYSLLSYVLAVNALLWKPVGSFDDPKIGFVCVGQPSSIRSLIL